VICGVADNQERHEALLQCHNKGEKRVVGSLDAQDLKVL